MKHQLSVSMSVFLEVSFEWVDCVKEVPLAWFIGGASFNPSKPP